jgi:hypothetical protein
LDQAPEQVVDLQARDSPPMLLAVEQILQDNLGKAIQDLGELGV